MSSGFPECRGALLQVQSCCFLPAKPPSLVELCGLLFAAAVHLWDGDHCGQGEEEAAHPVEEEDEHTTHCIKHRLEEEGDKEPKNVADQDGEGNDLVPDYKEDDKEDEHLTPDLRGEDLCRNYPDIGGETEVEEDEVGDKYDKGGGADGVGHVVVIGQEVASEEEEAGAEAGLAHYHHPPGEGGGG